MAQHDDVLDLEVDDGEFQRRAGAVPADIERARRYQVGDVPHHEQIARLGVGENRRIDPRIRAGDHHHFWLLLDSELLEKRPLRLERSALELQEACGDLP